MAMVEAGLAQGTGRTRMTVHAGPRPLPELLDLAAAASRSGTRLSFTGTGTRPLEDLVRLAVAGGETVTFGDDVRSRIPEDEETARPSAASTGLVRRLFSRLAVF